MSALRRRVGLSIAAVVASTVGSAVPAWVSTSSTTEVRSTGSTTGGSGVSTSSTTAEAKAALAAARRLFAQPGPRTYAPRAVASSGAREATLVLRDLSVALPDLRGEDAAVARRLLARPTDDGNVDDPGFHYSGPSEVDCTEHLCVHWVDRGRDGVDTTDTDGDGVPDWVETTQQTLETAWRHFGRAGYREPLSDEQLESHGPDGKVDVYLADVASLGFYGYCLPDGLTADVRTSPGFCVLDDDYAYEQVSTEPIVALRATAGHELFHLVQMAYDAREDPWLMEGTATWMEDEVFDSANDNWNYLPTSTLAHPGVPLDYGDDYFPYGAWTWWRFLSEYFGTDRTAAPAVVREVWEAAVGPRDSLTATRGVLARRGVPFARAFADYSALSHVARRWYFEGADAPYPQAPMARQVLLSRRHPGTGDMSTVRLDHLTSANLSVRRTTAMPARLGRLRLWVNGPERASQPAVEVTLHRRDGSLAWRSMRLDERGDGVLTVPFMRGRISRVVVTVVNASPRMDCRHSTTLACAGLPLDDGRAFAWRARVVR